MTTRLAGVVREAELPDSFVFLHIRTGRYYVIIRDILVRIQILGSVHMINGSGDAFFVTDFLNDNKK